MSNDPEILPEARRIVQYIRSHWPDDGDDVEECAEKILLLVNEWKDKAYREGFENGQESMHLQDR